MCIKRDILQDNVLLAQSRPLLAIQGLDAGQDLPGNGGTVVTEVADGLAVHLPAASRLPTVERSSHQPCTSCVSRNTLGYLADLPFRTRRTIALLVFFIADEALPETFITCRDKAHLEIVIDVVHLGIERSQAVAAGAVLRDAVRCATKGQYGPSCCWQLIGSSYMTTGYTGSTPVSHVRPSREANMDLLIVSLRPVEFGSGTDNELPRSMILYKASESVKSPSTRSPKPSFHLLYIWPKFS